MAEIDNIIEVQITRETITPTTASFNIPLFLAAHTRYTERYRVYTDLDELSDDHPSGNVYEWGEAIFGQEGVRPPSVVIGRRQVDSVAGAVPTATVSQTYSITVNGTVYSYVAVGGDDGVDVVAGIKAQYDLAPKVGVTFTNALDGTFTIANSVAGTAFQLLSSVGVNLTNNSPAETWVQALTAVEDANNEWYAATAETHVKADIEALAAAVQARSKIYLTSTDDTDVPSSATTDVVSNLKNANYTRTAIVYLTNADTQYPEAAWAGSQLPRTVGSNDWCYKTASGVTADNLNATQRNYLTSKNCNYFNIVAGIASFKYGDMVDGRPISEQIISDWTVARMQEAIYFRLINTLKIPYTKSGRTQIESEIRSVLAQGVANGAYASYEVFPPDLATISASNRANGIMGDFKFTAVLQGSVRKVTIKGTLTI